MIIYFIFGCRVMFQLIKKYFLILLFLASVLMLASCASEINKDSDLVLKDGEALLLVRTVATGKATGRILGGEFNIFKEKEFSISSGLVRVDESQKLRLIRIQKSGDMYIGNFSTGVGAANFGNDNYRFALRSSAINYIGDITVLQSNRKVLIVVNDNEGNSVDEAKRNYPELFKKYAYSKSIVKP